MAELKTQRNDGDVEAFIAGIADEQKRADCEELVRLMRDVTGEAPAMWGPSIVGFGSYHYRYESGREGDWFKVGFAPRKQNLTLYIMPGFQRFEELLGRLGKHTTGASCLYLKRLSDVDGGALRRLVEESVAHIDRSSS